MDENHGKATNIDEYIANFPAEVQDRLREMRAIIHAAAPEARETISYNMPAFTLHGQLCFFGGFKNHIGFYPIPSGLTAFEQELAGYTRGKGSVQFPLDQPLPTGLITRIVQFRAAENSKKAALKPAPKKH